MRPAISFVKKRFQDEDIMGAEIGVYRGDNAADILSNLPNVSLLFLIDPYEKYEEWRDSLKAVIEGARKIAEARLAPFSDRVKWIHRKSEDSVDEILAPLAFAYIDGNHAYNFVKKDIEVAMRLVRSGGVIGGHDYKRGVKKAVDEFCTANNIQLHLKLEPKKHSDWWFIKP